MSPNVTDSELVVRAKAGDEAPLAQHPHHEPRINPGRAAARGTKAGLTNRHRLEDRGDSVAQGRHHRGYETRHHVIDLTPPLRMAGAQHPDGSYLALPAQRSSY